jgi:oligopeptide/dipeptide ABC transporter ATP-binding protein
MSAPATEPAGEPILRVEGLEAGFPSAEGTARVLDGVDFTVQKGEILGIVGESGSGKTITALALMQLLPDACRVERGEIRFRGENLLALGPRGMNRLRGEAVSMIFQNPRTSLNPLFRVQKTLAQVLRTHRGLKGAAARRASLELLADVGLPDPERILRRYPHELSGGMCQRVMIALALASEPTLLIADEPTTALDVTVQLQVLELLAGLRREHELTLLLITHNLSVVAELCDRVMVMYLGRIVEHGPVTEVFDRPRHPYTIGLLRSRPSLNSGAELVAVPGSVPDSRDRPSGCPFHPRCEYAEERCRLERPVPQPAGPGHDVACHRWREVSL